MSPLPAVSSPSADAISIPQVALYAAVSFMVVSVFGVLLYITCSRRYRLNWFEQNLLETERETRAEAGGSSSTAAAAGGGREPLMGGGGTAAIPYNIDGVVGGGAEGGASGSESADPAFWVPASVQRQLNATAAANANAAHQAAMAAADCCNSADESLPQTPPASPTGSQTSAAFSIGSGQTTTTLGSMGGMGGGVPMMMRDARSDRHVVMGTPPPPQTLACTATGQQQGAVAGAAASANGARPKVSSMQAKLDPTQLDTSLYTFPTADDDNGAAVALHPTAAEPQHGMVHISLAYDIAGGMLTVRLHEAIDLVARDFSGTADPYARIRFLPDRQNRWQTRIHKRTLNPVFDEDFVFEAKPQALHRHGIEILMYDFDAYSRHVCIGGARIELADIDLTAGRVSMKMPLAACAEQNAPGARPDVGDLMVSLSYLPSAERMTVIVMKARNLRVVDDSRNSSDPYVKVSLWLGEKRLKKRKTGVYRNTLSPTFNEALQFDVSKEQLAKCVFEFLVLHDSLLDSNTVLGRALVGNSPDVQPDERVFFEDVLRAKTATAHWLPLSEMTPRSAAGAAQ